MSKSNKNGRGFFACAQAILLASILLNLSCGNSSNGEPRIIWPEPFVIVSVEPGVKAEGIQYISNGKESVDLSSLDFAQDFDAKTWQPLAFKEKTNTNVEEYFLRKGIAKLKDPSKASKELLAAEQIAKDAAIGIWTPPNPPEPPFDFSGWYSFLDEIKVILAIEIAMGLTLLGSILWVFKRIYKYLYLERNPKVYIIGEPASGKSVLIDAWKKPMQPNKQYAPTRKVQDTKLGTYFVGDFELDPIFKDVPGGDHAMAWRAFGEINKPLTRRAVVVVLSPIRTDGTDPSGGTVAKKRDINDVDKEFLAQQLGWIHGAVCGGLGYTNIRKPKVVIVFISKFDLFSDLDPLDNDANASALRISFKEHFKSHLKAVQTACENRQIPYVELVGSSYRGWNTEVVKETIYKATLNRL